MALCREVHHIVEAVLPEQFVGQAPVAYVSLDKDAAFAVDVAGNGAQVARIRKGVEHHDADIVVSLQQILNKVGADESGGAGHKKCLHNA